MNVGVHIYLGPNDDDQWSIDTPPEWDHGRGDVTLTIAEDVAVHWYGGADNQARAAQMLRAIADKIEEAGK